MNQKIKYTDGNDKVKGKKVQFHMSCNLRP